MSGECYVKSPTAEHSHTVILLHGRGSNSQEFSEDFLGSTTSDHRTLPEQFPTVRWVLPTASMRMSTVFRTVISEWFDIYSLSNPESRQDLQTEGLLESMRQIHSIISYELESVPPSNLFVGGISQGCATAIHTLLSQSNRLAAFIGICGWLPFAGKLEGIAALQDAGNRDRKLASFYAGDFYVSDSGTAAVQHSNSEAKSTPVFLCHGIDDKVVDISLGRRLRDTCSTLGMNVTWEEYDNCGHWIKEPEGMNSLATFLKRLINADAQAI